VLSPHRPQTVPQTPDARRHTPLAATTTPQQTANTNTATGDGARNQEGGRVPAPEPPQNRKHRPAADKNALPLPPGDGVSASMAFGVTSEGGLSAVLPIPCIALAPRSLGTLQSDRSWIPRTAMALCNLEPKTGLPVSQSHTPSFRKSPFVLTRTPTRGPRSHSTSCRSCSQCRCFYPHRRAN
jgi:hypothetical protein